MDNEGNRGRRRRTRICVHDTGMIGERSRCEGPTGWIGFVSIRFDEGDALVVEITRSDRPSSPSFLLLVLTTEHRTLAYALETFALLREVETIDNPRGLLSISVAADTSVFACPGLQRGHVRVEFLHDDSPYSPDDHDHKEDHDHHDRNHARTNHPHIMVADTDPDASTASITPSTSASASRPSVSPHSPRRRARLVSK